MLHSGCSTPLPRKPKELLKQLDMTKEGLTSEAAATRLSALGPNLLAHERQQTVLEELIERAKNPLNFLLLTLAALSYSLGDTRAAAVIAGMVVLSVSLAFVQEHRSNYAAARLRTMVRTRPSCGVQAPRPAGRHWRFRSRSSFPAMSCSFPLARHDHGRSASAHRERSVLE